MEFRDVFAQALRKLELAGRDEKTCTSKGPLLSELLGTFRWEVIYRRTYSYHWRALSDARLVLRRLYGNEAKWEDFVAFYNKMSMKRKLVPEDAPYAFNKSELKTQA